LYDNSKDAELFSHARLNAKVVTSSSYHFGAVGMAHPDSHMAVAKTKELNKVCVKGAFETVTNIWLVYSSERMAMGCRFHLRLEATLTSQQQ
jgi:hypothetical protein